MPASTSPSLVVVREGPAHVLKFRNSARANALDDGILDALVAELQPASVHGARCVLLGGDGDRHFSAGLDLGDLAGDALAARLRQGEQRLAAATTAIEACPVPVIAIINGATFGGALELAVACDWRLASAEAKLGMPAARLGVVYSPAGFARFVGAMGASRTRQLFLTGRSVSAQRALEIGLVDEVVPAANLWTCAARAASDISFTAPEAVRGTRAVIAALALSVSENVVEVATRARDRAFSSPDFPEGLAALREKRDPRWHDAP